MEIIKGYEAVNLIEATCKMGGSFTIAFYSYSRSKNRAVKTLKTYHNCTLRKQMPHDKFSIDGANYFLFDAENGEPKMCYKVLIRFIGLPQDNFKLKKVIWYE